VRHLRCAAVLLHSCRNRHCPKCQTLAKERWLAARQAELLPVPYFHLVFTLPHAPQCAGTGQPRTIYRLLFQAPRIRCSNSAPIHAGSADRSPPPWCCTPGARISGQHLHIHALVSAGALHADGHWIQSRRGFLFSGAGALAGVSPQFLAGLQRLLHAGRLRLATASAELGTGAAAQALLRELRAKPWVVYAKQPFAGPQQVLDYLGRYTHRVAISNHRLLGLTDTEVRFRYKDYAHGNRRKVMALPAAEFIRRFLLHVLPAGFMRIRHYGILPTAPNRPSSRERAKHSPVRQRKPTPHTPETVQTFWLRVAGRDITLCTNAGPDICTSSARWVERVHRHRLHLGYCELDLQTRSNAVGMPPVVMSRRRSSAPHPLTRIDLSDIVETTSTSHQPTSTPRHARLLDQASLRTDLRVPRRPPCKSQTIAL